MNSQSLKLYLKNSFGTRINRNLVAFYVDDWGSVRTKNTIALDNLIKKGVDISRNRFTKYDTLASEQDLSMLFDVLKSVKDKNGNNACFTAVTNPCNPNFDAIRENKFMQFVSEPFTETLQKYGKGYSKSIDYWKQGISENIFYPIFHGTEHVSRKQIMHALQQGHEPTIWAFENETVGISDVSGYNNIPGIMQPYYIETADDNKALSLNIKEGLSVFENIFGFRARQFRAGGDVISPALYPTLKEEGIEYMDETFVSKRHIGNGKHTNSFNYLGKRNHLRQGVLVRNIVFEPSNNLSFDSVGNCLKMVDIAFKCKKPAIISSHRVNFIGGLDKNNRQEALTRLSTLLQELINNWSDIEFVNADQLADIIFNKK